MWQSSSTWAFAERSVLPQWSTATFSLKWKWQKKLPKKIYGDKKRGGNKSMQQQSSSTWAALAGWEMYFLFFFAATLYWLWNHPGNQNESSSSQFQQSTIKLNLSSSGQQRSVLPLCFASTFYWPWNQPGNQKERDKMKVIPHCSINKTSMIKPNLSNFAN